MPLTLYELTWMSLPDNDASREAFEHAIAAAKRKMRKYIERDEQELAGNVQILPNRECNS